MVKEYINKFSGMGTDLFGFSNSWDYIPYLSRIIIISINE